MQIKRFSHMRGTKRRCLGSSLHILKLLIKYLSLHHSILPRTYLAYLYPHLLIVLLYYMIHYYYYYSITSLYKVASFRIFNSLSLYHYDTVLLTTNTKMHHFLYIHLSSLKQFLPIFLYIHTTNIMQKRA